MGEEIFITATEATPEIVLSKEANRFEMSGRSMPEDSIAFYQPVHEWIKKYISDPNPTTVLKLEFDYFNTSSARKLVELLLELSHLSNIGKELKVIWVYAEEDELIETKGREISLAVGFPFEMKSY